MSKLLNPPPGDIADRQTILLLKCKYGALMKRDISSFIKENDELQVHLQK